MREENAVSAGDVAIQTPKLYNKPSKRKTMDKNMYELKEDFRSFPSEVAQKPLSGSLVVYLKFPKVTMGGKSESFRKWLKNEFDGAKFVEKEQDVYASFEISPSLDVVEEIDDEFMNWSMNRKLRPLDYFFADDKNKYIGNARTVISKKDKYLKDSKQIKDGMNTIEENDTYRLYTNDRGFKIFEFLKEEDFQPIRLGFQKRNFRYWRQTPSGAHLIEALNHHRGKNFVVKVGEMEFKPFTLGM